MTDDKTDNFSQLPIEDLDVRHRSFEGTVYVIPLGAPLPQEIASFEPRSGELYERISALAHGTGQAAFAFVAVRGNELLALHKAWPLLVLAKKVAYMSELPGTKYDILFTQAVKLIGLPQAAWPDVSAYIAERSVQLQRTADTQPWVADQARRASRQLRNPSTKPLDGLPTPPAELQTGGDLEIDA